MTATVLAYPSSPIKRARRTKAAIEDIRAGLIEIVALDKPMTVRQVFYQAVVAGLVEKTEADYNGTVVRLLLEARRAGDLPYTWIADNTRWVRQPAVYSGVADFIARHARAYRRDPWAESGAYIEVWCEKDALAGVIMDSTAPYGVPLMVSRGFASESYLHGAADAITDRVIQGKQGFIYYFGDHDPSGLKISASIEAGLRRLCAGMVDGWDDDDLIFERIAVTPEQIEGWGCRPGRRRSTAIRTPRVGTSTTTQSSWMRSRPATSARW